MHLESFHGISMIGNEEMIPTPPGGAANGFLLIHTGGVVGENGKKTLLPQGTGDCKPGAFTEPGFLNCENDIVNRFVEVSTQQPCPPRIP